ncbi:hypothetical protein BKA93DRAFT_506826 [Sparassis latifolia]
MLSRDVCHTKRLKARRQVAVSAQFLLLPLPPPPSLLPPFTRLSTTSTMSSPRSRAPSAPTLHADADVSSPPTPHSLTSDWTPLVGEENAEPENLRRSDDDNELHADKAEGSILGPMPIEEFLDSIPAKHTARRPPTQEAFDDVDEPSRLVSDKALCASVAVVDADMRCGHSSRPSGITTVAQGSSSNTMPRT